MRQKKTNKTNFRRVLYYFWRALMQYKIRTITLLVLVPVWIFISDIVFPRGVSEIIGKLSSGETELSNYVGVLMMTLAPMLVNNLCLVRILDWLDWSLDAKGGQYLSSLAFSSIVEQSMTFHKDHFSGSLTSQANKLPGAFIDLKSRFMWDIYPLFLLIVYAIGAMWLVCPPFALILLAFAATYITLAVITFYKTRQIDIGLASAENKQTGALADVVTNVLSVKSYAKESEEIRRFKSATKRTYDATFAVAKVSLWRNSLLNIVSGATMVGVMILVILSRKWFGLSIADVVFLYTISGTLLANIWRINNILRAVNRGLGNAKEMVEILDLPVMVDDETDKALVIKQAEVEFSHISFRHDDQKTKLFDDFSLKIPAGKRVGLVGISGSGKTTLTKLLLRFDDVEAGAIYVDGQDIRTVTQQSLRENIAYVPQESSLFHRSIRENISYGRPEATEEEIREAVRLAHAEGFIKALPEGYETMVGERGLKLSGGQRQRIAIARAILKDAPILVLDEATSALDSESEAEIQKALDNLMRGRTAIVIAHRLSTVAGLDEIVVLRDGKIIEQGTHRKLLRNKGAYQKLWSRQSGAFLEEAGEE